VRERSEIREKREITGKKLRMPEEEREEERASMTAEARELG